MRKQAVLYFIIGALSAIILMGGGLFTMYWTGQEAEAQGNPNWQVQYFDDSGTFGFTVDTLQEWVGTLSADCEIVSTAQINIFLYHCP